MIKVLIVEDDELLAHTLALELKEMGHEVRTTGTIEEGREIAKTWDPALFLLDVHLPDQHDLQGLPQLSADLPLSYIVIITGDTENETIIEAMRSGAHDFLRKPLELDDLHAVVNRIEKCFHEQNHPSTKRDCSGEATPDTGEMIGSHPKVIKLLKEIGLLSRTTVPVLIEGESGTGKELVARILHNATCPDMPFVALNCASIVPTLLESELFGHEKGSFTGADKIKIGKLQYAEQGTVFLDEIGDLPLELQSKLLRVLQEEEFVRVGGLQPIPLKARIVAASNRNIQQMVEEKKFRQDLYFRLAVTKMEVPTLRERPGDIPLLVNNILARIARKLNRQSISIDSTALNRLKHYTWPGNIRELENMLTRAVVLSNNSILTIDNFSFAEPDYDNLNSHQISGLFSLADIEEKYIKYSLAANKWHITKTAEQLGISQTTLRKKISDYSLRPRRRESDR